MSFLPSNLLEVFIVPYLHRAIVMVTEHEQHIKGENELTYSGVYIHKYCLASVPPISLGERRYFEITVNSKTVKIFIHR